MLLIFFFHGLVFSVLLLRKGVLYQNKASKWLSLLLFLWSMYLVPYMLGYAGWYDGGSKQEIMFFVPFMQVLLIGPIFYFYTKSLLNPSFTLSRKDWIHFFPFLLYSIYSLIVFVTDKLLLDEYYFYTDYKDKDLSDWYQAVGLISMAFYLILSLRDYGNYKRLIYEKVSYAENILFSWIRNFMIAFLGLLILRVLFFIINPEWGNFGSQFWYYLFFSFVFYYISFNGYAHAVRASALSDADNAPATIFEEIESYTEQVPERENNLEKDILQWKPKLETLISECKLYQNPTLTLAEVANELNTNSKTVSVVVNSGFKMNFNDFINHYRVEAVIEQLKKGEQNTKTLLGIALDCGFNSKATFNRAFKKNTGLSPKDYIAKLF